MTDLELVLDACIAQLASGTASLDQCLAHYPEHAAQLRPLLQTALRFKAAGNVQAPSMFKTRARARLYAYMQAHPRHNRTTFSPVWKVAVGFAVLLVAFLTTGTAFAQNALPGQPLYAWKLSSEKIWRALAPDPLATDLTIAYRRYNDV